MDSSGSLSEGEMKLKHWIAFFVIDILVVWSIASAMWIFTKKDLLEIMIVAAMFSPVITILPFALLEEPEDEDDVRKKHFRIYTLREEEFYGRKIS